MDETNFEQLVEAIAMTTPSTESTKTGSTLPHFSFSKLLYFVSTQEASNHQGYNLRSFAKFQLKFSPAKAVCYNLSFKL